MEILAEISTSEYKVRVMSGRRTAAERQAAAMAAAERYYWAIQKAAK